MRSRRSGTAAPLEGLVEALRTESPRIADITSEWGTVGGGSRDSIGFSFRAVPQRDHWTCAYCGRIVSKTPRFEALLATVDHIVPVSRGGASSWLNLVCACKGCDGRKADRTPEEAGMGLRFEPYNPMVSYRVGGGHVEDLPAAA